MALIDIVSLFIFLTGFSSFMWILYRGFKRENRRFFSKIDFYTSELASNKHRIIENARLNGFAVGQVIYIKSVEGINIFYHFNSYEFLPDFLPNEEIMEDMKEVTQKFLQSKKPPHSFEQAIQLINEYYDYFPDSEAHLYSQDVFYKKPYVLPY
ncbi:hypothetical protein [Dyadobacter alkalitolerans]|uniref:hypothetical protein n=1 Tax=Dyadobacter alkalitolerans TaxID=492736 RepID=UPI000478D926|nr:hypothetical protein [Dyadobacter alkalitolerans]